MGFFGAVFKKYKEQRAITKVLKTLTWLAHYKIDEDKQAEVLEKIGKPAVEPLIAELRHKDLDHQWAAAYVLGEIGDARAVEPLIAVLEDKGWNYQWAAAEALGKIGDTRAVEPLIAVLEDKNEVARRKAAWALGEIGDAKAVVPLSTALWDKDSGVREEAAEALGNIGDTRAIKPLEELVQNDPNEDVRQAAKEALAEIRGE